MINVYYEDRIEHDNKDHHAEVPESPEALLIVDRDDEQSEHTARDVPPLDGEWVLLVDVLGLHVLVLEVDELEVLQYSRDELPG